MENTRFTDGRVPHPGIRDMFETPRRWQAYLDVEAALALVEAELGIIPVEAAKAIAEAADVDRLDQDRVRREMDRTSHPMMPLVVELSRAVGEEHGGWVHWGATTQNITQTGDLIVLRRAFDVIVSQVGRLLRVAADLADEHAETFMAGRTHGQHALPITFGFKAAAWADELIRHADRLEQLQPRLFVAMTGGAAGTFASLGELGPDVQQAVANRLHLGSMAIPGRSIVDHLAEYVLVLGLLATTGAKIGLEIYTLMATEVGELEEPVPAGTVGSSTMPHKRNPQLAQDVMNISAEIRALVPLALEGAIVGHEGDHAPALLERATRQSSILTGDLLERVHLILDNLGVHADRMRSNVDTSGGLITSEAVMLRLGGFIGRQAAHDVVYDVAQAVVVRGGTFAAHLARNPRVREHLSHGELDTLLEPSGLTGLSAQLARQGASRARERAASLAEGARHTT
ncbi:3-carboxy-cis,cis-muconate cycloisomerase [Humibacillus xanthopallidus]|uniref:3-carboxy-cis,cis-muconate cycloisomerase n=2 Tax=Humibacillus xanthopallidus TaxID=412689 RepID=A0A543HZI9_9MICO|nr:3-carboxy-cis,cis-muconate cycloisomerase [Humibacillus xanthopallidus]